LINVNKTFLPDKQRYLEYLNRIYESGWVTNEGALSLELQAKLEKYLGVKHVLLVSSGTVALQIAYKLLDLQSEVITTPFTFIATTSSLKWMGLEPIFADIDPESFVIDPSEIEKHITKKTSAIVPVHVFGNACNVEAIEEIAQLHGLKVIYDAAHAFGVRYKNESLLQHGDVSILSFHATKIFHTIEGGAMIINDDALYAKARAMINFGLTESSLPSVPGINAKMNEFQAAMGLCVLDDVDSIIHRQKEIYAYYKEHLADSIQLQSLNPDATQNYNYFPAVFESQTQMLKIKEALLEEGINPRRYFYPSLDTLAYVGKEQYTPVSRNISERILCLPIYPGLPEQIQAKILAIIKTNL
jgi:dTDP-4-amino-4,6-dideoxygalactose transaminase